MRYNGGTLPTKVKPDDWGNCFGKVPMVKLKEKASGQMGDRRRANRDLVKEDVGKVRFAERTQDRTHTLRSDNTVCKIEFWRVDP
jgi:hypothetical protein